MMEPLYGCNLQTNISEGPYQGTDVTCAGLTLYSGLADWYKVSLPAAYYLRELCQRYGMDILGPYSYAINLYENGIITSADVDLKLESGNEEALMRLLDLVAHRRGFGDLLAEGSSKTGETLGGEASRYVQTVKGLELISRDPQTRLAGNLYTTLSILTNPRGGDDLKGTHAVSNYPGVPLWAQKLGISRDDYTRWLINWLDMPEDFKVKLFGDPPNISRPDPVHMTIWYNNLTSAYNSLGLCMFASSAADALGPTSMAMLHSAATGCATTAEDIMLTGERVFNLMRLYDTREGVNRADDLWPDSISKEVSGEVSAFAADSEVGLDRYYRLRGWDLQTGRPEAQTLDRLGISV